MSTTTKERVTLPSVTEIAFASGFGSVLQLNRACREIFRAAPTQLRAQRRRSDRLIADGGLLMRLGFHGPLDWTAMLAYFRARAIPGVESVSDGVYRRTIVIAGHPGVIELGLGGSEYLLLRAHLPDWQGLIHIVQRARRIFSLDAPVERAQADLSRDPALAPLLPEHPGLRVPGTWDPFETGVRAIIGQQISIAAANTITSRLVRQFGQPIPGLDALGLDRTFPRPEALAEGDVSGLGLPAARARAIQSFARAVARGQIRLDCSVPLARLTDSITALPGFGSWTVHYLAL